MSLEMVPHSCIPLKKFRVYDRGRFLGYMTELSMTCEPIRSFGLYDSFYQEPGSKITIKFIIPVDDIYRMRKILDRKGKTHFYIKQGKSKITWGISGRPISFWDSILEHNKFREVEFTLESE